MKCLPMRRAACRMLHLRLTKVGNCQSPAPQQDDGKVLVVCARGWRSRERLGYVAGDYGGHKSGGDPTDPVTSYSAGGALSVELSR